jgi:hypothetical protein
VSTIWGNVFVIGDKELIREIESKLGDLK